MEPDFNIITASFLRLEMIMQRTVTRFPNMGEINSISLENNA